LPFALEINDGNDWKAIARAVTDDDGRARGAVPGVGLYRLTFDTARISRFFPEVQICFQIEDPREHYHVPLLLSLYGYTTYRGS
jgi:5-hydroxyisourate hydrolase